jgi:hypothetical protein
MSAMRRRRQAPVRSPSRRHARSGTGRAPPCAQVRVERVLVGRLGLRALGLGAQRRDVGRLGAVGRARRREDFGRAPAEAARQHLHRLLALAARRAPAPVSARPVSRSARSQAVCRAWCFHHCICMSVT